MVVKLTDVAELAGVSPTTVSRVINHKGYLSEKTITNVHKAMKQLHYQPNNMARSLQGKSTKLIGLIFPTLGSVFFAELTNFLEHELFVHGYKTIICNSENNPEKERDYIQMLSANQVEGIIAGSHNLNYEDYANVTAPIISFDRYLAPNIPIVSSDNYTGGHLAARELRKHNINKITIITGNDDKNSPTHLRIKGFKEELARENIIPDILSMGGKTTPVLKSGAIKEYLTKNKTEGIFCTDDMTALLVNNEAKVLGLKIPENLYLIGYDGVSFVRDYLPFLTTIEQPLTDLATLCVDLLEKRIQNHQVQLSRRYELPVRLISGETC